MPSRLLLVLLATGAPLLAACAADNPAPGIDVVAQGDRTEAGEDDIYVPATSEPAGPPEGWERPPDIVDLTGRPVVEVEVADNVFRTRDFVVDAGTEIVFVNVGSNDHNVKPSVPDSFPIVPDFKKGESAALRLDAPGDYPFFCSIHGAPGIGQIGYVIVTDA